MTKKALNVVFIALIGCLMAAGSSYAGGKVGIPKTGQTAIYGTGDDGALQKGVAWPNPRFTDNGTGTVSDNLTGLIWLKNANCFGAQVWPTALSDANALASGACGLSDGSAAGDWRLPDVNELDSLIDASQFNPALPAGNPFTNVQSLNYWSSTTYALDTRYAWDVNMDGGYVSNGRKIDSFYVWPVRGGQ